VEKKPEEFSLEYAGFWIRLAAGIIDLAIILSLIYSISSIAIRIFSDMPPLPTVGSFHYEQGIMAVAGISDQVEPARRDSFLITVVASLITMFYIVGMTVWQGQTLGKMVTGIKVIRTDSSSPDITHSVRRFLGLMLSVAILGIGLLWIAFDSRKQGIHDKIADTYVVKLPVRQLMLTESYMRGHVRQT
jgi:uncharacterized RDD family membrane protein YckC